MLGDEQRRPDIREVELTRHEGTHRAIAAAGGAPRARGPRAHQGVFDLEQVGILPRSLGDERRPERIPPGDEKRRDGGR
jgi:hypothetical protein